MTIFALIARQSLASKECTYTHFREHGLLTKGHLVADCSNNRALRDVPVDIRRETKVSFKTQTLRFFNIAPYKMITEITGFRFVA